MSLNRPKITQQQRVSKWKSNTETHTGYLQHSTQTQTNEDLPMERTSEYNPGSGRILNGEVDGVEAHTRQWEFRIAIYPSRDNLNKAINALSHVFSNEQHAEIAFKCFALNNPNEDADEIVRLQWDGTTAQGTDRDQRGKEICVYMTYSPQAKQYIRTPEQWKDLMLECWKALLDAEVEQIGYAHCPTGDKMVSAQSGIYTPFTYTAYKPWRGAHGILFQTTYNPYHHPDPLDGVVITSKDLSRHGIHISCSAGILQCRTNYFNAHFREVTNTLIQRIMQIKLTSSQNNQSLEQLIKTALTINTESIDMEIISRIISRLPRNSDSSFTVTDLSHRLSHHSAAGKQNEELKSVLVELLTYIQEERPNLIRNILYDINGNEFFTSNIASLAQIASVAELREMIECHTVEMQIIYRQLVHLEHEMQAHCLPEIAALINIIFDSNYWEECCKGVCELPRGITSLQEKYKALARPCSVMNAELDPQALIADCSQLRRRRQLNLFVKPVPMLQCFYQIFEEITDSNELGRSVAFKKLREDWEQYRLNLNLLSNRK